MGNLQMPEFQNQWKDLPDFKNMPQFKDMPDFKNLPKGDFKFEFPNGEGFAWTGGGRQIGVGITPLSKQLADHFRVEGGAMVSEVRENSPAAKAGLKAGDIIVEAGGKPVRNQMDLIKAINEKKDGDVQLTIVRDGNRQTISVTPEAAKDEFLFHSDTDDGLMSPPAPALLPLYKHAQPAIPASPAKLISLYSSGRII